MLRPLPIAGVILALLLAPMSSACTAGLDSPLALETKTRDDPFLPYVATAGKTIEMYAGPITSERHTVSLLARRDRKTGVLTTHAHIQLRYHQVAHRRYETARNDRAEALGLKAISSMGAGCRKPEGCPHLEEFLVDIPEPQLREAQQSGYKFKVFNKAGEWVYFQVPPQLVKALFVASDSPTGAKAAETKAAETKAAETKAAASQPR